MLKAAAGMPMSALRGLATSGLSKAADESIMMIMIMIVIMIMMIMIIKLIKMI